MVGWTDVPLVLTTLKSATDIAKAIIAAQGTLDKAELKYQLAELMGTLVDARVQAVEMQEAMHRLAGELAEAKEKLAFAGTMEYEDPYYFNVADGKRDGPYCAPCWEKDKLAVHLYQWSAGSWTCNICKSSVHDASDRGD